MTIPFCFKTIIEINLLDQLRSCYRFFYCHEIDLLYSALFSPSKIHPQSVPLPPPQLFSLPSVKLAHNVEMSSLKTYFYFLIPISL